MSQNENNEEILENENIDNENENEDPVEIENNENNENIDNNENEEVENNINPEDAENMQNIENTEERNLEDGEDIQEVVATDLNEENEINENQQQSNKEIASEKNEENEDERDDNEEKVDLQNDNLGDVESSEEIDLDLYENSNKKPQAIVIKEPVALTEDQKYAVTEWINGLKLSRKIQNYPKDFSDGVLYAEILKKHFPKFIEMHNYIPTLNQKKKEINWATLNYKVLKKIALLISKKGIDRIVKMEKDYVERHLFALKERVKF